MTRTLIRLMLGGVLVGVTAAATLAQSTTETKKFQVIAVEGNKLVVSLPEGTKELTVPDDFRFMVDGVDENGKAVGHFEATGVRPAFMHRLEAAGVRLPANLFASRRLS